ncbi:uncharacterized protein LOC135170319 [Diachasmimorpha longicaudata]|uniref:uncharacterized protein LOC135170319 n=1 Tax=Diachasmimorpha longicaudata TaxID=58733 RepID=UPI0030B89179
MVTITRLSLIKIVELIIVCVVIILHVNHHGVSAEDVFLSAGTEVGFLIILTGLFAGAITGTPVNRRVELFFLLVGCAMFIASGAITLDRYGGNRAVARGSLSIVEGVLLLLDGFLIFRGEA